MSDIGKTIKTGVKEKPSREAEREPIKLPDFEPQPVREEPVRV